MKINFNRKINWFWVHRRNASLHQFGLVMDGLHGKGWHPVVNFWFDNQIVIGVPGKGCYVFYDRDQLDGKYKDIQRSIDKNPDFVKDFQQRTNELFGAIFFKCEIIDAENLSLISQKELFDIYNDFIETVKIAPIITVQLWGIEACLDEKYKIIKFLKKKLKSIGKEENLNTYVENLSTNTGETVALTERKNFYQVAVNLNKPEILKIFKSDDLKEISKEIKKFNTENSLIEKHIKKYEWMHTEYVSKGWTRENWIALFKEALLDPISPNIRLEDIQNNFSISNRKRKTLLEELNPPKNILHAIDALAEFIAQRDWTKGYFTKILLSYNNLLDEIAERIGISRSDIYYYSHIEVGNYLLKNEIVPIEEIQKRRKEGFGIIIKGGVFDLISGQKAVSELIMKENINAPFENLAAANEFKGKAASKGKTTGTARVIEDASKISDFKKGEILITYMTTIEFIPAFRKASAVVTDEGGMSCHAAIISREFGIPCIVGTKVATRTIKDGDLVEVDANSGIVKILK